MKLVIGIIFSIAFPLAINAQKCLQLSTLSLMGKLEMPGNASQNFAQCNTKKVKKTTEIVDYGDYLNNLKSLNDQKIKDFTNSQLEASAGNTAEMPTNGQIQDAQQLAEKLQKMTPEQQKTWAMAQANQQMQQHHTTPLRDDPAVLKLVQQTYTLSVVQLNNLDKEMENKVRTVHFAMLKALDSMKEVDYYKSCPPIDKEGDISCDCVDNLRADFFKRKIKVTDGFDHQKVAIMQHYLPRIKGLISQVEENIVKLKYGAGIQTKQYQKNLFLAQQQSFLIGFGIISALIEGIHKEGSDLYVNKLNCDNRANCD